MVVFYNIYFPFRNELAAIARRFILISMLLNKCPQHSRTNLFPLNFDCFQVEFLTRKLEEGTK